MFLYKHKSILSLLAAMMHCKMTLLRVPDECHSLGSKAASTVDVQRIRNIDVSKATFDTSITLMFWVELTLNWILYCFSELIIRENTKYSSCGINKTLIPQNVGKL